MWRGWAGGGGSRRRWRDDGGSLHAVVREVLHLDRLSDEQLGLAALLVLDGLVDVHDLFANVLVHFGQPLRDLGAVGRLLGHPVVETLWGETERERARAGLGISARRSKTRTSSAALEAPRHLGRSSACWETEAAWAERPSSSWWPRRSRCGS